MAFKGWQKIKILNKESLKQAIAPIIISASRSTDIPAFYSDWFINRLEVGFVKWVNPFNRAEQLVSFQHARVIVFWTKNAKPILNQLKEIDKKGINYYFTYTLNDYEKEGLEPNIPKLCNRIDTFKQLSDTLGRQKVIWRFDPLLLSNNLTVDILLERIEKLGQRLKDFTEKLVVSFADIETYTKVKSNLAKKRNAIYKELNLESMHKIAEGLEEINNSLKLQITTCSEKIDLSKYGIEHNKCVDDDLMIRLFSNDEMLMNFLGYENHIQTSLFDKKEVRQRKLKDPGQRKDCGCIVSKDIGQYNTCKHHCTYCYANHSEKLVIRNFERFKKEGNENETILLNK